MLRLLWLCLFVTPLANGEVLQIPVGQQGSFEHEQALPQFGERKISVLERFGLADQEHPAVGQPPISRWDYRDFSVYFERDVVINSVRHHRPQQQPVGTKP